MGEEASNPFAGNGQAGMLLPIVQGICDDGSRVQHIRKSLETVCPPSAPHPISDESDK